jgi:hypothetical protein
VPQSVDVVFYENFESYGTGTVPTSPPPPGAGSWYGTDPRVQYYASHIGTDGEQTLEFWWNGNQYHAYGEPTRSAANGKPVHLEFDLKWNGSGRPWLGLMTGSQSTDELNDAAMLLWPNPSDNHVWVYDGAVSSDTGVPVTPNAWQRYELDYVVGSGSYDLTVDGATSNLTTFVTGNDSKAVTAAFWTASPSVAGAVYYLDAVKMTLPPPKGTVLVLK